MALKLEPMLVVSLRDLNADSAAVKPPSCSVRPPMWKVPSGPLEPAFWLLAEVPLMLSDVQSVFGDG